jgi:addiction module RelE/StbE family toxin
MSWTLQFAEGFEIDFARANKKTQKAYSKTVRQRLVEGPTDHHDNAIKKLAEWKDMWRYRISNEYRLVYLVNQQAKTVTLCLLDHRKKVYDRLGHIDGQGPSIEVIADEDMEHLLERVPSDSDRGRAGLLVAKSEADNKPSGNSEEPLPFPLTEQLLSEWGIASRHHDALIACKTTWQLLEVSLPHDVHEYVLNCICPPKLKERLSRPVRVMNDEDSFEQIFNGEKSLEEFLLALDKTQQPFVNRFKVENPIGPWLVKGGPGSGKSTVALYCIKELVRARANQLPMGDQRLRILFTTYTHALVNASRQLLRHLGVDRDLVSLEITNVNKLARTHLDSRWNSIQTIQRNGHECQGFLQNALSLQKRDARGMPYFDSLDTEFLLDEIEECLIGEDIANLKGYLAHDRIGRGVPLDEKRRKAVWEIFSSFNQALRDANCCLFSHQFQAASQAALGIYDFVFVDEAQDLQPVAIRLCARLAKNPSHVFLTADLNQSIYGSGFSWKKVADGLDFRGKAVNLKKNYRSTKEIWDGILPILEGMKGSDKETLDEEPFRSGELPTKALVDRDSEADVIGNWITEALLAERLAPSCAAVLCPTNGMCQNIAANLPRHLNAKFMSSRGMNLDHKGVKVMTLHAAKGLQFPVVTVAGLNRNYLPRRATGGRDIKEVEERSRRLFFVACSRAMNRLFVVGSRGEASAFFYDLPEEYWEENE